MRAGEIKLRVEARLGELIVAEQEAGRLAKQGDRKSKCDSVVTFKQVGLSRKDSQRAQMVASNSGLIDEVVSEARLGELIQAEQEAGRLTKQGQPKKGRSVATLKDVGLSWKDSQHAKLVAANKELIATSQPRAVFRNPSVPALTAANLYTAGPWRQPRCFRIALTLHVPLRKDQPL